MREIQYYRPDHVSLDTNTVLISGHCPEVKKNVVSRQLKTVSENGYKTVIIDFGRTADFSGFLNHCGYSSIHTFVTGKDNYLPLEIPIYEAVSKLRTHAQRLGYTHSVYSQMTTYINFLMKIDQAYDKDLTLQQLLRKFNNQDKFEREILSLVRDHTITGQEAEEYIQTYLEFAVGGVTADTLLSELEFILKPNIGTEGFSLSYLKPGEAAVLYASNNNSTDINDYMSRLWSSDLIGMSEKDQLMIVINAGHYPQISRMYELVETLSHKTNTKILYCSYDLFADVSAEKAKSFAKIFTYDLYGTHSNDSAKTISSMFSEQWLTQFNYANTRDQRVLHERMLDKLLGTDYTMTVSTTLIKESVIPAERIVNLRPREVVIFNTLTNTAYSARI